MSELEDATDVLAELDQEVEQARARKDVRRVSGLLVQRARQQSRLDYARYVMKHHPKPGKRSE